MFARIFCQLSAALQDQGDAAMLPGGVWPQAADNFNGEQLAYIAALATGAQLVFGDRPKATTYARLATIPSLKQLDAAFERQVLINYLEVVREVAGEARAAALALELQPQLQAPDVVDDIMMLEREVVMLQVVEEVLGSITIAQVSSSDASGADSGAGAQEGASAGCAVALVVGAAHLPGLRQLWDGGAWRRLLAAQTLAESPLLAAAAPAAAEGSGVRRGVLEAVLQLSVTEEVLEDLAGVLPPVPEEEEEAYSWSREIWGTYRMQLAVLPRPLLEAVCGSAEGADGGGGMWDALAPLRELRPSAGGAGWCTDLGMQLRGLNLDVSEE